MAFVGGGSDVGPIPSTAAVGASARTAQGTTSGDDTPKTIPFTVVPEEGKSGYYTASFSVPRGLVQTLAEHPIMANGGSFELRPDEALSSRSSPTTSLCLQSSLRPRPARARGLYAQHSTRRSQNARLRLLPLAWLDAWMTLTEWRPRNSVPYVETIIRARLHMQCAIVSSTCKKILARR
eukprot:TRINITY_DN24306_c0_g1_i2.p1 TRINITY_DN24306_c0_g1~~TRINITY_DN24306_c0_g1_i2.p1  ORF type:complete len:180 (-),score=20.14 TRINITY_DN24306_c0_g1_i2:56-595(-)